MSDLVVLNFDGVDSADAVLTKLRQLKKQELIDLLDACVVVRPGDGEIHIKQSVNMTALGATSGLSTGAIVGMLAGLLVFNPLAGMAVGGLAGAAMGALGGKLSDFGINDDFIKELGETLKPDSSALFLLVAKATPDKVIAEIEQYKPRILQTSLSQEQEDKLLYAKEARAPGNPFNKRWKGWDRKLMAIDAKSGQHSWETSSRILPGTLAVNGGTAYFHNSERVVALDKQTGESIWETRAPDAELGSAGQPGAGYGSIVISNGAGIKQYVQLVGRGLIGVSAEDGRLLCLEIARSR